MRARVYGLRSVKRQLDRHRDAKGVTDYVSPADAELADENDGFACPG